MRSFCDWGFFSRKNAQEAQGPLLWRVIFMGQDNQRASLGG
jgi:hypothetical protein